MTILRKLWARRPIKAVFAAMLGILSVVGATLSFAGPASATLTATPISYGGILPDIIGLLPSGNFIFGYGNAIEAGATDQPVAGYTFDVSDTGTVTSGVTSGTWADGDVIAIPVFDSAGNINDVSTGDYVEFASVPLMDCEGGGSGVVQPTFTVTTGENPADSIGDSGLTDVLYITFTNNPGLGSPTNFECAVFNITYTTGVNTPVGPITNTNAAATESPTYTQGTAPAGVNLIDDGGASDPFQAPLDVAFANATVIGATVTANTPPVSVLPNALNAPISNIVVTEATPGSIPAGYICLIATSGGFVVTPTAPTLTVSASSSGGEASVAGSMSGLASTEASNGSFGTISADVLTASTTTPTTFTFAGLTVDAPGATGPVYVTIVVGASDATCANGTDLTVQGNPDFTDDDSGTGLVMYAVGQSTPNTRIAGSTTDQTAVAALEYQYPPHPGFCIDQGTNPDPTRFDAGSSVVLATDGSWQDALTASYLASWLGTGVLLTPGGTVSPYALQAIQDEGVNNVIIVGGTLAVSQAVQNQLAATPAYQCGGGSTQVNALGAPIDLSVQRVAGANADATAEAVATYVDSGYVGNLNISGAFGLYNDTLGTDSGSSPSVPVRTAILVTDDSFQDAASASALSYSEDLPILLTPPTSLGTNAETGLLDLGIQQVIELGGNLAISDAVNSSLESQGISVLRIAGADGSETSVQLAKFELNTNTSHLAPEGLSWATGCSSNTVPILGTPYNTGCTTVVGLARGDYFSDALTSSVVTGGGAFGATNRRPYPIILAESPNNLGTYATTFFNDAGGPYGIDPNNYTPLTSILGSGVAITSITVFGGPLAISNATLQAAFAAMAAG